MSIGSFLLSKERLELVRRKSWKFGRPEILDQALRYYEQHPGEVARIVANLDYMGLPSSGAALDEVLREIAAHYYEKLFVLVKRYEAVWIARNRVEIAPGALEPFEEARARGQAVFMGQSHFGATYLMALALTARGFDLHAVGNFPEPVGSILRASNQRFSKRYGTGITHFINLAEPDVDAPGEMMRQLHTGGFVSNVFDENNVFCRPQRLLGRPVMGGTGMDLILRGFDDQRVVVVTPFLVRTSDDSFRYEADRHYLAQGDIIASFYRSLERRVRQWPAQWYFLHELHHSIPEGTQG